jgi:predicted oxidoreductase
MDEVAGSYNVDRAAVAVAFLLAHPAGILPILGTNNLERIKKINDVNRVEIDRVVWFRLYEAALGHEVA